MAFIIGMDEEVVAVDEDAAANGGGGGFSREVLNCSTNEDPSGRNGQSTTSAAESGERKEKRE